VYQSRDDSGKPQYVDNFWGFWKALGLISDKKENEDRSGNGQESRCKACTQLLGGWVRENTTQPLKAVQRANKGEIEGQAVCHYTATPHFLFYRSHTVHDTKRQIITRKLHFRHIEQENAPAAARMRRSAERFCCEK